MPDPFKLACPCGFAAETGDAFATHVVETGHAIPADEWAEIKRGGDARYAEMVETFNQLQAIVSGGAMPEGVEIRQVDIEEELDDPDVPEEAKDAMRRFLRERVDTSGPLASGPFAGKHVALAPHTRVDAYAGEIAAILCAIGYPEALVTDESRLSDFDLEPLELALVEAELPTMFTAPDELLVDIAARIRVATQKDA